MSQLNRLSIHQSPFLTLLTFSLLSTLAPRAAEVHEDARRRFNSKNIAAAGRERNICNNCTGIGQRSATISISAKNVIIVLPAHKYVAIFTLLGGFLGTKERKPALAPMPSRFFVLPRRCEGGERGCDG